MRPGGEAAKFLWLRKQQSHRTTHNAHTHNTLAEDFGMLLASHNLSVLLFLS